MDLLVRFRKVGMKLALILIFLGCSVLSLGQPLKCPVGKKSIMIDGRFENTEWAEAAVITVNDSLRLYFKQDSENVYWCLRGLFKKPVLGGVDFYSNTGSMTANLHASAQLGERPLRENSYGDFTWWNNASWIANVARIDKLAERKFHMDEAKEFQIRKTALVKSGFRIMFEVSSPKTLAAKYPTSANPLDPSGWLEVSLD
jgi:hypothetical protein